MLLLNYDLHDIHWILVMLRFKPTATYNAEVIRAVIEVLEAPQADNIIDDNIIRRRLRSLVGLDKEDFYWIDVDNVYTYGVAVIHSDVCYSVLTKGFQLLLEYANAGEFKHIEDLADALHNIPIFFAEGRRNFKKVAKVEFSRYNRSYKTNLLKELLR